MTLPHAEEHDVTYRNSSTESCDNQDLSGFQPWVDQRDRTVNVAANTTYYALRLKQVHVASPTDCVLDDGLHPMDIYSVLFRLYGSPRLKVHGIL